MSVNEENKICRACAEPIKATARLCPFCQTRQVGFPYWQMAGLCSGLLFGTVALLATVWLLPREGRENGPRFAPHRRELVVTRTTVERARETPSSWVHALGTNQWDRRWSLHEITVRFLDPQGSPLEVHQPDTGYIPVGPCYWLTGFLTNTGRYPWRVSELEVRVLDARTNLAGVENLYFSDSLLVQPHSEQAFRVEFSNRRFTNTGSLRQVRVQDAAFAD